MHSETHSDAHSPGEGAARIQERLQKDLVRVREALHTLLLPPHSRIREPLLYSVENAGRLLRPTLVLLASYLLDREEGGRTDHRVIEGAAVVETLHIATLHHDDVIDEAQIRRGKPSINAKYGNAIALLTGDYLLARCMEGAAALGRTELVVMAETLTDMCVGQMLESSQLHDPTRSEADYFAAISGKTARLLRTAAAMGALQSQAADGEREALEAFGHNLGMAFQIWDDILDICSRETGKQQAKDILNGVYTLPVIYAVQDSGIRLETILREQPLSAEQCGEAVALVQETGAIARAAKVAQRYTDDALRAVETHPATASHAPVVRRCLSDLVGSFAAQHPALRALSDAA
ncbi:polyprenyl synthetase family protein [Streptomyces sp. NRRL WC-3742]|uniref:polyprenyl synthetase family protein n=1 Tax=Streptomyces sp. NRRL WC-3742 TaxID=1463934 RepID=UPI0004C58477|nr:polyprenyl synthetase family protein [Streptomyces sp. NRRL WC-3742]